MGRKRRKRRPSDDAPLAGLEGAGFATDRQAAKFAQKTLRDVLKSATKVGSSSFKAMAAESRADAEEARATAALAETAAPPPSSSRASAPGPSSSSSSCESASDEPLSPPRLRPARPARPDRPKRPLRPAPLGEQPRLATLPAVPLGADELPELLRQHDVPR